MPARPRSHVVGDVGVNAFKAALPPEWVARGDQPDYGIDMNVEIVVGGQLTGLRFHAQVKATDAESEADILGYSFDLDALSYYRSLAEPVLLVRYSSILDLVLYRWAHSVHLGHGDGQRTIRVAFPKTNILAEAVPTRITQDVESFRFWREQVPRFPIQVAVTSDLPGSALRTARALQNLPSRSQGLVSFRAGSPGVGEVALVLSSESLTVSAAELCSSTVHLPGRPEDVIPHRLFGVVKSQLALVLDQLGRRDMAGRLLGTESDIALIRDPVVAHRVTELLLMLGRDEDALNVWNDLAAEHQVDALFGAVEGLLHVGPALDPATVKKFDAALSAWVEGLEGTARLSDRAAFAQALGAMRSNTGNFRDAIRALRAAKSWNPDLATHVVWLRDVALALYELGRYKAAEHAYDTLFKIDGLAATKCRLADVRLFMGQYERSRNTFADATQLAAVAEQPHEAIWVLRWRVARAAAGLVPSQARDEATATRKVGDGDPLDALNDDVLSADAWSALGRELLGAGESEYARDAFMFAATIDTARLHDLAIALGLHLAAYSPGQDAEVEVLALVSVGVQRFGIEGFVDNVSDCWEESGIGDPASLVDALNHFLDVVIRSGSDVYFIPQASDELRSLED